MVRGLLRGGAARQAFSWTAVTLLGHALRGLWLLTVGARLPRPATVRTGLIVAHRVFPFR
ncbi:hypothetical protein [Streptomyces sp. NPDC058671]|uniref:hypothetical protein n=1 Tax=Streptomyces sp. NPDC058671 TaxID=3346590 RepID=UPI003655A82F